MIRHKIAEVDGLHVFYREAGDPANPKPRAAARLSGLFAPVPQPHACT